MGPGAAHRLHPPLVGLAWVMVPKIYHFHNLPPILPILQKGRTTVE